MKIGEFVVPVTSAGELWLYVGRDRPERYVSAGKLLGPGGPSPEARAALEGSIVFVGTSAAGLQDIRTTALGENVPGVSLHAQTVEQILSGRFLSRPDWADGLEIMAIALLGTLLVLLTFFFSPAIALFCGLALTGLALVASWFAFALYGLLFDPLAPILAGSITHFAATSFRFLVTDRERRQIRRAFGQYLSPSLLHRIENNRDALRLGGDDRELTVMFVDVRNFTEMSESLSPTAVVGFLNTLLDALSRHVTDQRGHARQVHRRFHHGLLERAGRRRRPRGQGRAGGAGDAPDHDRAQPARRLRLRVGQPRQHRRRHPYRRRLRGQYGMRRRASTIRRWATR